MTRNDPSKYIIAPTPVYIYHMNPPYIIYIYERNIHSYSNMYEKSKDKTPYTFRHSHNIYPKKRYEFDTHCLQIKYLLCVNVSLHT